jgi:hypothetical protein
VGPDALVSLYMRVGAQYGERRWRPELPNRRVLASRRWLWAA